jgi:hypothetical protein
VNICFFVVIFYLLNHSANKRVILLLKRRRRRRKNPYLSSTSNLQIQTLTTIDDILHSTELQKNTKPLP